MNIKHIRLSFITISLLVFILFCGCSKRDVYLRFEFAEKTRHRYHFFTNLNAQISDTATVSNYSSLADMRINLHVQHVYPNGDGLCSLTVDSLTYKTDFYSPAEAAHLKNQVLNNQLTVKLSPYGDFLEVNEPGAIPQIDIGDLGLSRLLLKFLPALPHSGIKVGESWDREQQIPVNNGISSGTLYIKKHFRLLTVEKFRNRNCAKISVNMLFHLGIKEKDPFKLTGTSGSICKGSGLLYFDLRSGLLIEAKADLDADVEASIIHPVTNEKSVFPVVFQQHMTLALEER